MTTPSDLRTDTPSLYRRFRRTVIGAPRNLSDSSLFHRMALVPFLAWVGLGADGLSSSSYGPEEAFKALERYPFLALGLAALMGGTVLLIAAAYRRIIEEFPTGGGGYVVASKLLGARAGVTSGSALLVDYALTITTSIAAAGDAIFSFVPPQWQSAKLTVEIGFLLLLTTLNLRGVRESVLALMPVFLVFLLTHALLIGGGILFHLPELSRTAAGAQQNLHQGVSLIGVGGLLLLFLRAYSLGGGTYTGIEAVSNGLPIMREPRVQTGKRTMSYMALSLAVTASGLLLCYLLWGITPVAGQTMNAVLVGKMTLHLPGGHLFSLVTILSEGALLVVAAQAGFLDGPRVLSNMAIDSWVPHRFAALSERLTTQNGILLMGAAALAALVYTRGDVSHLIVMYSINVFLTFSLSMLAMLRYWIGDGRARTEWKRRTVLFGGALLLCSTILVITTYEKFAAGGWVTVVVTALLISLCMVIRRHYARARAHTDRLFSELGALPTQHAEALPFAAVDARQPVAVVLVANYGGVGIHTLLNVFRTFPDCYRGVIFAAVGVLDSAEFKGHNGVEDLRVRTAEMLDRYVALCSGLGIPATGRMALGTDLVDEAEKLCEAIGREYPRATFFAGKMIFERERWWHALLHNQTARAVQQRLQWAGRTMVTLPVRVREG